MDKIDQQLLNAVQSGFPLTPRPFQALGDEMGIAEEAVIARLSHSKAEGLIRQISAIFDTRSLGYQSSLVAMKIAPESLDQAAAIINEHPGVSHNYQRNHDFNLWFTIAVPQESSLEGTVKRLGVMAGAESTRLLPTLRLFKIGVHLDMTGEEDATAQETAGYNEASRPSDAITFTDKDKAVVRELQENIPLTPHPFAESAARLGMSEADLLARAQRLADLGIMRRFAAILGHRKAGFAANAMGIWKVPEAQVLPVGEQMASFKAVTHCYQRPAYPDWPYSIFTMVHGHKAGDCEAILAAISQATGIAEYAALYSTKEYKKTRMRYFTPEIAEWERRYLA